MSTAMSRQLTHGDRQGTAIGNACMLFQGGHAHPSHRAFGDAIDAEYRHFETGRPPERRPDGTYTNQDCRSPTDRLRTARGLSDAYDTIVAEGSAPLQTLLAHGASKSDTTSLYLAADEAFYILPNRRTQHVWRASRPFIERVLDGCVAVGRDVYEWVTPYVGSVPVRYVHPPITEPKYHMLYDCEPRSPGHPFTVLAVGDARPRRTSHYSRQQ
jgi:hypothetical protein